jgi:NADH dehydrogenase FAD-containing subunit
VDPSRREFFGAGAALALAGTVAPAQAESLALPFFMGGGGQRLLSKGKAQRVVICGGGWGGLTAAKYLRRLAPGLEVILLERNPVFFSCPLSNKWLVEIVNTDFLVHDYLKVSEKHGYRFIRSEILGIDRTAKRVSTNLGWLEYDYLVLAPGIRYNYEAWFGEDRDAASATRARFPAAYIPNDEHFTLKRALHGFEGGEWVMTLPPPPQRCPPSPYERACMVAWWFKSHRIKGHVTILDHKDGVRPIGPGFRAAFEELYKDYITYVPNAHVEEIDPFAKTISTSAGDMKFDHAVLMAPHQAGDIVWMADAIGRNKEGKATGWADMHATGLHLNGDRDVFVIGDAVGFVSEQFAFYPKSAHVANRLGRIVARYVAERAAGREPEVALPDNLCYMAVNGDPQEALNVQFDYALDEKGMIVQTQRDYNERTPEFIRENFRWAGFMFEDMFA